MEVSITETIAVLQILLRLATALPAIARDVADMIDHLKGSSDPAVQQQAHAISIALNGTLKAPLAEETTPPPRRVADIAPS